MFQFIYPLKTCTGIARGRCFYANEQKETLKAYPESYRTRKTNTFSVLMVMNPVSSQHRKMSSLYAWMSMIFQSKTWNWNSSSARLLSGHLDVFKPIGKISACYKTNKKLLAEDDYKQRSLTSKCTFQLYPDDGNLWKRSAKEDLLSEYSKIVYRKHIFDGLCSILAVWR